LQTTMSLLNMQTSYLSSDDAKEAIRNSQRRMYAMSLIHQKLYQSDNLTSINMKTYIDELVHYLKESYRTDKIKFNVFSESIELDLAQAIPLGLIINEAVTNSIKYAFPDKASGEIDIKFKSRAINSFILVVADNGIGMLDKTEKDQTNTLGLNLIKGLSSQINGKLEIRGNSGLSLTIVFENDIIG